MGKKLTTYVGDLAISGNKVPCVEIDSSIKDTILEITSKKLGMALVVNNEEVVGIFTDGDLRRALNQEIDIENNSVSSVMTKKFISISENDLAIDAANSWRRTKFLHLMSLITKNNPQSLQCISFLNLALYEIYFQSFLSNDSNLASHYASANQNEFKINAEIIDYDPSKKIILLDGAYP